uniref:Ig-like domain-containing protein n=1 Tax=Monodelphis domestica TaxID=13616 RepID=A0A5F8GEG6_MONDO
PLSAPFLPSATILSCWIQPTSAQGFTVVQTPATVKEGDNVILNIQGYTGSAREYVWYRKKSAQDPGRVKIVTFYSNHLYQSPSNIRQKVLANGSLIIPNLIVIDDGYYEVQINDSSSQILKGGAPLKVYENTLIKPTITIQSTGHIVENDSAVMSCNSKHKDLSQIRWYFQNKKLILNKRMSLPLNNQTLIIIPVMREDNGAYKCEVWNPFSASMSDLFKLTVCCECL